MLFLALVSFSISLVIGGYAVFRWGGDLFWLFLAGALLAWFYTAKPLRLKARALGDLAIFLCFGPLPMLGVYFMQTHEWHHLPLYFSLGPGLLAVAILHANNTRDIEKDRRASTVTLAQLLGRHRSYYFYLFLVWLPYALVVLLAAAYNSGPVSMALFLLPLLSAPVAYRLTQRFRGLCYADGKGGGSGNNHSTLVEETAQFSGLFGLLWIVGVLLASHIA